MKLAKALTDEQRERLKSRIGSYPYSLFSRMSGINQVDGYKSLMNGEALCCGSWGFAICFDDSRKVASYYRMPKAHFDVSAMPRNAFFQDNPQLVECPSGPGWDRPEFVKNVSAMIQDQKAESAASNKSLEDMQQREVFADASEIAGTKSLEVGNGQIELRSVSEGQNSASKESSQPRKPREKSGKAWKQVVSVRLDQWQIEALEMEADGEAVGMVIRKAVREYLRARGYDE